jgi:hypothetical protein
MHLAGGKRNRARVVAPFPAFGRKGVGDCSGGVSGLPVCAVLDRPSFGWKGIPVDRIRAERSHQAETAQQFDAQVIIIDANILDLLLVSAFAHDFSLYWTLLK